MPTLNILDKGPCVIVWKYGESDAAYLGPTLGDVKLTLETNASDINEDQQGDAAVSAVLTGSVMNLETPLTRLDIDQLAVALNSEVDGQTVPIVNQVGCDLYELSHELVIKPLCGNEIDEDPAHWVNIYHAYPLVNLDYTWNKDTQRIIPLKWKIFVSQESGEGGFFGTQGMDSGATEFGLEPL